MRSVTDPPNSQLSFEVAKAIADADAILREAESRLRRHELEKRKAELKAVIEKNHPRGGAR